MSNPTENTVSEQIASLLAELSLEEKIAQMTCASGKEFIDEETGEWIGNDIARERLKHGVGQITRLGGITKLSPHKIANIYNRVQTILMEETHCKIPVINREECLSGYMIAGASMFPQMITVASAWNRTLVFQMTDIIRKEMRAVGATHAMSPNLDVVRDPRWGRVEESFGEDPYLVSALGCQYIDGLQSQDLKQGVASCGKHFLAHGIPEGGTNWSPVMIGNRELREVFGRPFEAATQQSSMASIMAAYHEIDGIPVHSSSAILNDLYKNQMHGDGIIISDAMGIQTLQSYHNIAKDAIEAAAYACNAGVNIELPFRTCYGDPLLQAVEKGLVSEATIDERVRKILKLKFELGLFDDPYVSLDKIKHSYNSSQSTEISKQLAQEGIVLLKNKNSVLPLPKDLKKIIIIGPTGNDVRYLLGDYSFQVQSEGIGEFEGDNSIGDLYVVKYNTESDWTAPSIFEAIQQKITSDSQIEYLKGCDHINPDKADFKRVKRRARKASVIILTLGGKSGFSDDCTSGETRDRVKINLPGIQEDLIAELAQLGKPMIGILINGRPYALENVIDHFDALIEAWLPGIHGGEAIANVIFGDYNPSGKIPITFPRSVGQIPIYYNHKPSGMHSQFMGDYVDGPVSPRFPFGHGLSYTSFAFDGLEIQSKKTTSSDIQVSFLVKNIGARAGEIVVQLYIQDMIASISRPVKELKGFCRLSLKPDQVKKISFDLPAGLLGFLNREMDYVVEPGEFRIMIGESSENIVLEQKIELTGNITTFTTHPFFSQDSVEIPDHIPADLFSLKKKSPKLSVESTVKEIMENPDGKAVLRATFGKFVDSRKIKFAYKMKLSDLQKFAPQFLTDEKLAVLDKELQELD